jgi:hypothetical protein
MFALASALLAQVFNKRTAEEDHPDQIDTNQRSKPNPPLDDQSIQDVQPNITATTTLQSDQPLEDVETEGEEEEEEEEDEEEDDEERGISVASLTTLKQAYALGDMTAVNQANERFPHDDALNHKICI